MLSIINMTMEQKECQKWKEEIKFRSKTANFETIDLYAWDSWKLIKYAMIKLAKTSSQSSAKSLLQIILGANCFTAMCLSIQCLNQQETLKTDHFACLPHSSPPSTCLPKSYQWESHLQNQNWLAAEAQQAVSVRKTNMLQIFFSILCFLLTHLYSVVITDLNLQTHIAQQYLDVRQVCKIWWLEEKYNLYLCDSLISITLATVDCRKLGTFFTWRQENGNQLHRKFPEIQLMIFECFLLFIL